MGKTIAVVAGGNSEEVNISINSGRVVVKHLQLTNYEPVLVLLRGQKWEAEYEGEAYSIDKNDFSFSVSGKRIGFDAAYITIHGSPGEDGPLQGYFELIGLPYTSPGVLNSAVTFNKWYCNSLLREMGIKCAKSVLLREGQQIDYAQLGQQLGFPCFVKPNNGGSSFGISKVKKEEELAGAIKEAFKRGDQVIVEALLSGTEVTNAVLPWEGGVKALSPTEIVPEGEFFDYAAKYEGKSQEITPARISPELTKKVQERAKEVYTRLGLNSLVRVDLIIQDEEPFVVEINTVPGLSEASIVPKQAAEAGIKLSAIFSNLLDHCIARAEGTLKALEV
jgi:D-alanine-D-alanine ligase